MKWLHSKKCGGSRLKHLGPWTYGSFDGSSSFGGHSERLLKLHQAWDFTVRVQEAAGFLETLETLICWKAPSFLPNPYALWLLLTRK